MFKFKKTVASLTAGLTKMVADLEGHAEEMEFSIAGDREQITILHDAIADKSKERNSALTTASRLRSLLGTSKD